MGTTSFKIVNHGNCGSKSLFLFSESIKRPNVSAFLEGEEEEE